MTILDPYVTVFTGTEQQTYKGDQYSKSYFA